MINTILGSKKNMEQAFVGEFRVPTTVILAGPCMVTQIKSEDRDGYWAVQLGFSEKKLSKLNKPLKGHLKGATKNKLAPRFLREVKLTEKSDLNVGDKISLADIFSLGDKISVTGTSKGKGFAGVVKRWGFAGGPRTHGQSDRERAPGSIGQGTEIGRVFKGKKMGGRMGTDTVTISNLQVVGMDEQSNEMAVSGPIPGSPGGLLVIKKTGSGKLNLGKKTTKQSAKGAGTKRATKTDEENVEKEGDKS